MHAPPALLALTLCAGCAATAASPEPPTATASPSALPAAEAAPLLTVSVKCRDSTTCMPKGRELFIVVSITNDQSEAVGVPLSYLRRVGPAVRVTDARTHSASYRGTSPADPEQKKELTKVEPGATVSFEWVISREELPQTGLGTADVTAEITIKADVEVGGKTVPFVGSDTIRVGKAAQP
jgi:hypothetical protein